MSAHIAGVHPYISAMLKMEKTPDGHYFLYLVNGDMYEIDHKTARMVENYFEGR